MITTIEENKNLIKEFKVETKEKNKKLSIYYGDILKDTSDLVGISVYDNEKNKGDLYDAFQKSMQEADGYKEERLFLKEDKLWTSLSVSKNNSRSILLIHSAGLEGELINQEKLRSMLKMVFATINSFTFEGNQASSVALPVLFRKGVKKEDYMKYVQSFIYEASECLRKNSSVEELKIYIWHKQEAEFWLKILHNELTVSLDDDLRDEQEKEVRKDILIHLEKTLFKKTLPSWLIRKTVKELESVNENIFPLVNYGNKVVDFISSDLIRIMELSSQNTSMNPYQRIFTIKSTRSLVEWFGDYMYSIKVFKNYAGNLSPSPLEKYYFLLQFAQVLFYYERICSAQGEVDHANK